MKASAITWGPPLAVAVAIFVLSSFPGDRLVPDPFPHADKVAHAVIYGVLAAALMHGLSRGTRWRLISRVLVTLLGVGAYGALDELHQLLVPGRNADLMDLAADVGGGGFAAIGWCLFCRDPRRGAT